MSKSMGALHGLFGSLGGALAGGFIAGALSKPGSPLHEENILVGAGLGALAGSLLGGAMAASYGAKTCATAALPAGSPGPETIPGPPTTRPPTVAPSPGPSPSPLPPQRGASVEPPGTWTIWGWDESGKTWFLVWSKYQTDPADGSRLSFAQAILLARAHWRVTYVFDMARNTFNIDWYAPNGVVPVTNPPAA